MVKLYTCVEISERYQVPIATVWLWIRKKKLSAIKIGKEYRVTEDDILLFEKNLKTIK